MIASIGKYSDYEDVDEATNREEKWHAAYLVIALLVLLSLKMLGIELSWWGGIFVGTPLVLVFMILQIASAAGKG